MAEAQGCSHGTLYRALNYPLACFFTLSLQPQGATSLSPTSTSPAPLGQLGLKHLRSSKDGTYPYGFSLVVLAWIVAESF